MKPYESFSLDDWLYALEYHQHKGIKSIDLGLVRVSLVAERLNLCDLGVPVITVTGTNGKGSTVATLESIYCAAGYQVASYTSPHLLQFNERIRVNQTPISDALLVRAFCEIERVRDGVPLTYFETTTLAALWYFKQCALDVVVLEVGIGGRLDATNIIDASLAIITTVAMDHQEYLGTTRDAIGYEKAGILREAIPLVYADFDPPNSIFREASLHQATMYSLGVDYSFEVLEHALRVTLEEKVMDLPLPEVNSKAAVGALVASYCLRAHLPIGLAAWSKALSSVRIMGRQQVFHGRVTTVYDVAHNPQAVLLLADFIAAYPCRGKVFAVFSGLKDKDLCGLIRPMRALIDGWYPTLLQGARAADASTLLAALHHEGCVAKACFGDPVAAFEAAQQQAKEGDLIVVYGSFLTVSAVLAKQLRLAEELQ